MFFLILFGGGFFAWKFIFRSNIIFNEKNESFLYIPKNTDFDGLIKILEEKNFVHDITSFSWYAQRLHLQDCIHPGKYRLTKGMSNRQFIKMLKQGKEEKVSLTINYTIRTLPQLYEKLCGKFNINETAISSFTQNEELLEKKFDVNPNTLATIIHPGKYELSWATEIEDFFDFMFQIDSAFWNSEKKVKLKKFSLDKGQVLTLASIVYCESNIESEQRKIAGVYMNRLKENMLLQADPTVIYALNDFSIQRLSFNDLKVDSPYNTYKYKGLPPGPVSFPSEISILSVLNYEKSNYLYFCAKPELNGYSNFSSTYEQHLQYAEMYRKALNKRGIRRN